MRTSTRTVKPKELIWRHYTSGYIAGWEALIGKWQVYKIFYDSCRSKDDPNKYSLITALPGLKSNLGHFLDINAAKNKANSVFQYWLKESGL